MLLCLRIIHWDLVSVKDVKVKKAPLGFANSIALLGVFAIETPSMWVDV